MPTLDELIAQERKIAEHNHNMYEFECMCYGKDTVDSEEKMECVKQYEYHSQLVELLEELKKRRSEDYGYMADIHEGIGYRKAIDDAMEKSAKAICIGCGYLKGTKCTYTGCNCGVSKPMLETVMKALEQLKADGDNE